MSFYMIDEDAARRNKEAMSFDEYTPNSATDSYRTQVMQAREIAEQQKKKVAERHHEKIDYYLDKYEKKLAENLNAANRIGASVPSVMITGGSNFPTGRKQKQIAALDRNMEEYNKIQRYLDKIKSIGMGGISSDDDDALTQLENKLEDMKNAHAEMKKINAFWRKHQTLDGCANVSKHALKTAKENQEVWGECYAGVPFPTYALQNSNQNMKRIEQRIKELKRKEEKPWKDWSFDGGVVEMDYDDNRIKIFFDDKPDAEIRTVLKKNGFRWSPSNQAWQRMLNLNGVRAAKYIDFLQPIKQAA